LILADTSAWVEYDRATGSPAHRRLRDLIAVDGALATTEPVVMEMLVGARSTRHEADLRRLLRRAALLRFDTVTDFEGAAWIYRRCRACGVTPRVMLDCMIAAVALRREATLLAHDRDLECVARVMGIELDRASLRASDSD
jgi:predicted nucleic acid-binding protein